MSLAEIHTHAKRFQTRIRARNAAEYFAAAVVVMTFGWMAFALPVPMVQAGAALIVAGALYVCWQLNEIGRAATKAEFDQAASLTLVRSSFDDTNLLVPYVPDLVFRSDTALHADLPVRIRGDKLRGALGSGITYVGRRELPFSERSQRILTVDASATLGLGNVELGVIASNLLDNRYRLSEYNYSSVFQQGGPPTLVASRHFVAGAPRAVFGTLTMTLGGS